MIYFRATDGQVSEIAALAVEAAKPLGIGHLHHKEGTKYEGDEFPVTEQYGSRCIHLDYIDGRAVKLSMWMKEPGVWKMRPRPGAKELVKLVGASLIEDYE